MSRLETLPMSQSTSNIGLATQRVVDVRTYRSRSRSSKTSRESLEVKLAALQQDYAELHTAIFEAAQVHRRLCAPRSVRLGAFEIASEIFAVRHLPGDFFTVTPADGYAILALGDIRGKGLAAGMWTTHLVGLVSHYASIMSEPERIVAGVNNDLCRIASAIGIASLFLARLDTTNGTLDYCSAGHPPGLLLRSDGRLESLTQGGMLLGVAPGVPYLRGTVNLNASDALLIYSDGVLDSQNEREEDFGFERVERELRRARNSCADSMLFSLLGAVQDFAAPRPLVDDMSLVVVRRDSGEVH